MSIFVIRNLGVLAVLASLHWVSSASIAALAASGATSPGGAAVSPHARPFTQGLEAPPSGGILMAAAAPGKDSSKGGDAPVETPSGSQDVVGAVEAALKSGTVAVRQAAILSLAGNKSERADKLLLSLLEDLKAGRLAPELGADVLEVAEGRGKEPFGGLVKRILAGDGSPLAPHRFALKGGNVELGRKIFFERADVACVRCHTADAAGGEVGPNLQGVARRNPPEYLLESVVLPNARIAPGFENVMIETTSGVLVAGALKSENEKEIVVNSPEEGPITLARSEVKSRQRGLSGMPEGMGQILSRKELRDLLAYLATLKD